LVADIGGVDRHRFALAVSASKLSSSIRLLHHRLQAAGTDILDAFVHLRGDLRDFAHRVVR